MGAHTSGVRTVREVTLGDLELRLVEKNKLFFGIINSAGTRRLQIEGDNADDVWRRLHDEAGKANPKYFGFDGARARFLHWFEGGFNSPSYISKERDYKLAAKAKLDALAPLEKAATGSGYGEAILSGFQTNLLSPYENMRVRDTLRSPAADAFIRAAARFTLGEGKEVVPFSGTVWRLG